MSAISIRKLSADSVVDRESWAAIKTICCRTGNNGEPIAQERWEFFAKVWIQPYEEILPQWAYVAEAEDAIVGYLTGCPDTKGFSRAKRWRCTFPLALQALFGSFRHAPGAPSFARQALGIRKSVEGSFTSNIAREIFRFYPAHLHMNVERQFRRAGIGKLLLEKFLGDLRKQGVSGIHLYCGRDPMPFYLSAGFQLLGTSRFRGSEVFALGQLLKVR